MCVIDEQTKDTLQDLRNSEWVEDSELEPDKNTVYQAGSGTRSSGLVMEVENESATRYVNPMGGAAPSRNTVSSGKSGIILHPNGYQEALSSGQYVGWKTAMREEFASLKPNDTWTYVPAGNEYAIGCRGVIRTKVNADGSTCLKARLVIKGYEQVEGTDYTDTYAPVAKLVTFRLLLALAAKHRWIIHYMDVLTACLNPPVDEDIYMDPPEGIEWLENSWAVNNPMICKLRKFLYGLNQAPRLLYKHIDSSLKAL